MNAAEHKAEAERLLSKANSSPPGTPIAIVAAILAEAQVHAMLATIPDPTEVEAPPADQGWLGLPPPDPRYP